MSDRTDMLDTISEHFREGLATSIAWPHTDEAPNLHRGLRPRRKRPRVSRVVAQPCLQEHLARPLHRDQARRPRARGVVGAVVELDAGGNESVGQGPTAASTDQEPPYAAGAQGPGARPAGLAAWADVAQHAPRQEGPGWSGGSVAVSGDERFLRQREHARAISDEDVPPTGRRAGEAAHLAASQRRSWGVRSACGKAKG